MKARLGGDVWLSSWCVVLIGCALGACNRHLGEWEAEDADREVEVALQDDAGERNAAPSAWRDTDPDGAEPATPPPLAPPTPPALGSVQRCEPARLDESCGLGSGVGLADDATVATMGDIYYFAGGAVLPAGHYRLAYVDGCMTFDVGVSGVFGWTIHWTTGDVLTGLAATWAVSDDRLVALAPGSVGVSPGMGAFATYEGCVQANCSTTPIEFDFEGGRLGMRYGAGVPLVYLTGAAEGGRGPTFHLTRTGPCP